jgi:hypothetical protein
MGIPYVDLLQALDPSVIFRYHEIYTVLYQGWGGDRLKAQAAKAAATIIGTGNLDPLRVVRLPTNLADFSRRGFRLDRPADRALLERHAEYFLTGFNLVAEYKSDPHSALAGIPAEERGFAYEGAGMRAALVDLMTCGRAGSLRRLLDGPGLRYVHLIHVGYGWALAPLRPPLPFRLPRTPLLRWLALDGAGFAETYFGDFTALRKRCRRRPTPRSQARLAGAGRALWFLESADIPGIVDRIESVPAAARPQLWAGVGLAACYAGCADERRLEDLGEASGPCVAYLGQGALFGAAARVLSGVVPAHTRLLCEKLFSVTPEVASGWTDVAAEGLSCRRDLAAYLEWKKRLREKADSRCKAA